MLDTIFNYDSKPQSQFVTPVSHIDRVLRDYKLVLLFLNNGWDENSSQCQEQILAQLHYAEIKHSDCLKEVM